MVNLVKNDKSAGRDLKKIFLPNKKHYSVISDSIRNFLAGGIVARGIAERGAIANFGHLGFLKFNNSKSY